MSVNEFIYSLNNIVIIYLVILCLSSFILVILSSLSFYHYLKTKNFIQEFKDDNALDYVPVSLLVPAYNEEITICSTIDSLLSLDYHQYEIIIINDGSVDETANVVKSTYDLQPVYKPMKVSIKTKEVVSIYKGKKGNVFITLINKINGGKADSLNVGINYAKYPLFVAIDADSILKRDSLEKIVIPFMKNEKTVAVGGNIKLANFVTIKNGEIVHIQKPKGFLIPFQILEYLRAFLTNRMAWNVVNMNLIISGAFGAFNKKVVIDAGGYKTDTVGEDMELVMRLHKKFLKSKEEYYISFVPDAICYTQAPDTLKGLKIQRRRWQIGLIHSMAIHKSMFTDKKWFLAKMYFLFFELITPIIELFGMVLIVIAFLLNVINVEFLLLYCFMIFVYGLAISNVAILLEVYAFDKIDRKKVKKLFLLAPFEAFGYRQLVSLYRISAFIGYRKNKYKWGSIQRKQQKEGTQ
ncbi:MAG: glycosyltransferase [Bacillaceae bacterium]